MVRCGSGAQGSIPGAGAFRPHARTRAEPEPGRHDGADRGMGDGAAVPDGASRLPRPALPIKFP
jgi:hypothetical protein